MNKKIFYLKRPNLLSFKIVCFDTGGNFEFFAVNDKMNHSTSNIKIFDFIEASRKLKFTKQNFNKF